MEVDGRMQVDKREDKGEEKSREEKHDTSLIRIIYGKKGQESYVRTYLKSPRVED